MFYIDIVFIRQWILQIALGEQLTDNLKKLSALMYPIKGNYFFGI